MELNRHTPPTSGILHPGLLIFPLETYFLSREGGCKSTTSLEIAASVESLDGGSGDRNSNTYSTTVAPSRLHCVPNPASEQATLLFDTDLPCEGQISIYDLQGRLLRLLSYSFEIGRNVITLSDFAQLPVGVLNVAIFDGQAMHTTRVVKN